MNTENNSWALSNSKIEVISVLTFIVVQGCSLSRNDINFIWAADYFAETTFDDDAGAFTCDTLAISATSRTRTTCRYRFWPVGLAFRSRLCDYLEEPSKALTNAVNLPTGPPTVSRPISSIGLGELGLIRSWSLTKAWLPVSSSENSSFWMMRPQTELLPRSPRDINRRI